MGSFRLLRGADQEENCSLGMNMVRQLACALDPLTKTRL